MASSRRQYFRKTRKTRLRDLKHSKQGLIGMAASLTAVVLFAVSVSWSFLQAGEAEFQVGSLGLIGLVLAVGALILGILGVREQKVRLAPPRTGIVLGLIMTVVFGGLYAYGMM